MNKQEIQNQLDPWKQQNVRDAWLPITEESYDDSHSHFGGAPMVPKGESWPECPNCKNPWQLFLQVDLEKLPDELAGHQGPGLLQFFYCTEEDCEQMDGWSPHAIGHGIFVRALADCEKALVPDGHEPFPKNTIQSWEKISDFPDPEDYTENGLDWQYDFDNSKVRISCPSLNIDLTDIPMDEVEAEDISLAQGGDKLGGWPSWVQGAEWVICRECGKRMEMLFQLDSEVNVPYMWGDCGVGHISRCLDHPDEWAFGWACG